MAGKIDVDSWEVNQDFNSDLKYNLDYLEDLSTYDDLYPELIEDLYLTASNCTENCNGLFIIIEKLIEAEKTGDQDLFYEILGDLYDVDIVDNVTEIIDSPNPKSDFWEPLKKGIDFERDIVKPIYLSSSGIRNHPDYLWLKNVAESEYGVNIDDFAVFEQVQLTYTTINGKDKWFTSDFLLLRFDGDNIMM